MRLQEVAEIFTQPADAHEPFDQVQVTRVY